MRNVSFITKTIMDKQLCELLKIALQNPEGSPERDQAAEALALMIDQLSEPKNYINKNLLPYYEEALKKKTQPDVRKNIHQFFKKYKLNIEDINCQNSDDNQLIRRQFINWVMMILKPDCIDTYYKYNPKKNQKTRKPPTRVISMAQPIKTNKNNEEVAIAQDIIKCPKLSGLEQLLQDELQYFAKKLKKYIEEDKDDRLKSCYPRNNNQCNCQTLAIKLYGLQDPPIKTKEIAKMLDVPEPTVFDRWREYCIPLFKKIARELGYE